MVIPEILYVDWVSKEIVDFYKRFGYSVQYTAVTQPIEKTYPFDRLYAIATDIQGVAILALQFKAPDIHSYGLKFSLDTSQLNQLKKEEFRNWIYYAFPYFTLYELSFNCLYLTNFLNPLLVPPLDKFSNKFIFWRKPYYFIEFNSDIDSDLVNYIETYKLFDEFYYKTGNNDDGNWVLTRKSCVHMLEEKKMRYEIPHLSFGELFNALYTKTIGKFFNDKSEVEEFIKILQKFATKNTPAICIALNSIKKVVEIVAILSGYKKEFNENIEKRILF